MKIAVDCHPLKSNKSGVGHLLNTLLKELVQNRPNDKFYLYAPQNSLELKELSKYKNVIVKICPFLRQSSIIWGQITLPLNLLKDDIDILWSTNHLAPIFLYKNIKNLISVNDFVYKIQSDTLKLSRRIALNIISRFTFNLSRFYLTISTGTCEKLQKYYNIKSAKIINPPVREQFFDISEDQLDEFLLKNNLKKKKYLLFVGNLEPRKNLQSILLTYQKSIELYGINNCYPLVMIGAKGWKNNEILQLIDSMSKKYPQNILIPGYVSDEELPYYYKGAGYLLFPSLYEGYGMPVAEARVVGTAVITSNIPELIEAAEGDGVFLDPYKLENQLVEYFMINEDDTIPKLSKKVGYYSTKELAEQLIDYLYEIKK
jgi:glycosyltransferase involved in cell wall biosynthesis